MHQSNSNNNGNGTPKSHRGAEPSTSPPDNKVAASQDQSRWLDELAELRSEVRDLTGAVGALVKAVGESLAQVSELRDAVRELQLQVESVMIPMAEQNRDLRQKEVDEKFLFPIMNGMAQIIDRQSAEITQAESESPLLAFMENCRAIDRQELQDLMSMFDVESFTSLPGRLLDPKLHSVKTARTTPHQARIGRVIRTLRPGYRRHSDGLLIRRALVEVWGQAATKVE
jgi:hypothetical protein